MGKMQIKIKYLRDIKKIQHSSMGDWIDLRAGESVFLRAGETARIPLGIAMELPKGYEAIVAPRSSTLSNFWIMETNSIGVIDESYCGDNDEWCLPVIAIKDTHILKNDRICQFRIIKHQPDLQLVEVELLGNKDRGGFGSTGVK